MSGRFLSETQKLSSLLTSVVESGAKEYDELGGVQFSRNSGLTVEKGIRRMMKPVWEAYQDWLVSLGVKTRSEAEQLWKSFGEDEDVQRCVQKLQKAEEEYDALLKKVEVDVQKQEDMVQMICAAMQFNMHIMYCLGGGGGGGGGGLSNPIYQKCEKFY